MPRIAAQTFTGLLLAGLLATQASAAEPPPLIDFNRDVRSILSVHCLKCHGRDPGNRQAGLRPVSYTHLTLPTKA